MAAKVVMLAVPTVLGIASIRVYTVSDAPTDGLLTREKLNFYTPVPQSAQAQFVPERPGLIESGFTSAREGILPFAQAVQGACVSVKRGSVNLYHTGQDVYYYLKDPPPGFLPRFGTITMAGLLGMFLARKGSRFKRLALPLGLMSAGASVCYPAQTVAVVKVTGRKVYAVGKWSSAAVSSLMTSKPQAEETTTSQPRSVAASGPESAEVSSTTLEREVETAESVSVSHEPSAAVITKEESSATLAEISPDGAPAEISTDPVVQSADAPEETEPAPPAEEPPAPVESKEPSDTNEASDEASSAETTASTEPEMIEAPPVPPPAEVESAPSSEDPPPLQASDEPAGVESADRPELADLRPVAAVDETPTLTPPPPPPAEQPAAENSKGGSDFKPDPALMDFGQSSPEDEDLYSTRS